MSTEIRSKRKTQGYTNKPKSQDTLSAMVRRLQHLTEHQYFTHCSMPESSAAILSRLACN